MKKRDIILLTLFVVGLILVAGGIYFYKATEKSLQELSDMQIEDIDLMVIDDGVYEGSYSAFPVSVEVKVTVQNHIITNIEIVKHVTGQGQSAEVIIESVILEQSLDVDIILGATYSSKVILLAIQDALTS